MVDRHSSRWVTACSGIATLCYLAIGCADGKVIFVSKASVGPTRDGTSWTMAYQAIQTALDSAGANDEVWVAKGAYPESVTVAGAGVGLFGGFAGSETARAQRDPKKNPTDITVGWVMTTGAAGIAPVTVSGFNIHNAGGGITVDGPSAIITDNVISALNGSTSGVALGIHGNVTVSNNVITGNWTSTTGTIFVYQDGAATITNNVITLNQSIQGSGIYVQGTATIANNLITDNASYSRGGAVYVSSGGTATLVNNTIANNVCTNGDGAALFTDGTAMVTNCIVTTNDSGLGAAATASLTVSASDVFGNTAWDYKGIANPTGTAGNISTDPLFRWPGDYHLATGSACIDTGNDAAVTTGATDVYGGPRIAGAHVDMGACEYVAAPKFITVDVTKALRAAAGIDLISTSDFGSLNVETAGDSTYAVDIADAIRIARKVAGIDSNP